jgi:hypothetical protein
LPEALALVAALVCSAIGLAWLALTLEPHWRQVRGAEPLPASTARALRALGVLMLLLSLGLCLLADHLSMAVLVWPMLLAVAALLVAFTFTWRPRLLAPLVIWIGRY